jgi:polygalacturonase
MIPSPRLLASLALALAAPGAGLASDASPTKPATVAPLEWADVPALVAAIQAPRIPARIFSLADFGAKGDGATDTLPAINRAIEQCARAGGGKIVVPKGEYLVNGPIHLQSNLELHLDDGATLRFSGNPADFLPLVTVRWEGTLLQNYSPLIYARGAHDIAITGQGIIDGNARREFTGWLKRQDPAQARLRKMGAEGAPMAERQFGEGSFLRPSMLQPFECTRVLIEGVTLRDSPFWVVHPTFCTDVTVRGITVDSDALNNDGCDPDSCRNVLIEDCTFRTGDDGIALKAGRDADAWRDGRVTERVVIRRCHFQSKINSLCIGSEMSAGVRGVFMEDCDVEGGESCIYFKSNRDRGGFIENVRARRIHVGVSRAALVRFETNYHSYRGGNAPTTFRDFVIEDVTCGDAMAYGVYASGTEDSPIREVVLNRVTIAKAREPVFLRNAPLRLREVSANGATLPEWPAMTPPETPPLKMRY